MAISVSIIIPTFNEAKDLPRLLKSIKNQTQPPQEVIVADAFSVDETVKIARKFGATVVAGGLPAKARNSGAKIAGSSILLFLDADVILPPKFLEQTVMEMQKRSLDITSCFITPRSKLRRDKFLHHFANYYMRMTQKFHPHIPGSCIFVKSTLHKTIGGFDESLFMAEDHDYLKRAKKMGKFGYLKSYKIPVSVRRLSEEGRINIALKYIAVELHLLFIGEIRKNIFEYKFGRHFKS
ncbi:hypothetical protein A3B42_00405 [Candidatus Daviesbacteria bacterium RIFCSPLOWO2_01_FULL_38_10]|uniref:Glycosyl transferase family 2 n=1 Tax=Candidatus Daviesbacteria bacterium GW2011_GWF2_38_6 TaxID=1618432 RepID=A0A0G0MXC4_9BACT|nr:MAG: Glycosyl transferase family 2 [Candidatus Daviesbacteria bacterium GW2011_GWF2_38_6]OGE27931.1 MAG: hypothetical protein A3D02_02535 [Candidatus Daviesbacteria bacterium RIFCSPHIGHO2_02_FULL_39_41]OGE39402.1 MAG: hypothetical protein A3B42_00405 [Candidatus Daviesbacteria bacterium RIFCSPLOWO2_01_FULL_38_10]OGE44211.1 MAG: hypothetical protein A3E67_04935 [Candidatus Daviesbacteria bacterium RIFCSPHIGHO2_12_FULL_38_25]OGE68389.1 MAG: hypothetical protein A3H81_02535 [Candidatus Daviesba